MIKCIQILFLSLIYFQSFASNELVLGTYIVKTNTGYELIRNGENYFVKGAGGYQYLNQLKDIGGNSIRTWGVDNAKQILDDAHKLGITVCLGLWVGHERHGFNYDDEYAVEGQLESFKKTINEFKDHPALLMWAVGNEMDLFYKNFKVWNAVEDIAAMIKSVDKKHPVMTVTAGFDPAEAYLIKTSCPSIDILGINTYGGISTLSKMIRQSCWDKPYMVTEWGPFGHWESSKTTWKASIELTSKEKAEVRNNAYSHIVNDSNLCLGSYCFLWGYKQEETPTWYGIFSKEGYATQSVDVLNDNWKNSNRNKAPIIDEILLNQKTRYESVKISKKDVCELSTKIYDPEGDKLNYYFEVLPENYQKVEGGDFQKSLEKVNINIISNENGNLKFKAPLKRGAYRIFVYADDGQKNVATANFPFYVK